MADSPWASVPIVVLSPPACPHCGHLGEPDQAWGPFEVSHCRVKTITVDGHKRRLMVCTRCSERFAIDPLTP